MSSDDPLMVGMFWGGLLVASVPMGLGLVIGTYVLRRYLRDRRGRASEVDGSFPPRGDPFIH